MGYPAVATASMLATAIQSVGAQFRRSARRAWTSFGRILPAGTGGVHAADGPIDGTDARSPTERILGTVEGHDGRIEQAAVVSELDLSPATVSRKLTDLESDGRVVRYRVGRGKIVCLPDRVPEGVPDAAGSDGARGRS